MMFLKEWGAIAVLVLFVSIVVIYGNPLLSLVLIVVCGVVVGRESGGKQGFLAGGALIICSLLVVLAGAAISEKLGLRKQNVLGVVVASVVGALPLAVLVQSIRRREDAQ